MRFVIALLLANASAISMRQMETAYLASLGDAVPSELGGAGPAPAGAKAPAAAAKAPAAAAKAPLPDVKVAPTSKEVAAKEQAKPIVEKPGAGEKGAQMDAKEKE